MIAAEAAGSARAFPRVLHVLEATLGGTLRYLENIQAAFTPSPIPMGLAYATRRADHRLAPALACARSLGWELFPVPMRREIHPPSDLRSAWELGRVLRRFRPDVVHLHSSKAGALGRVAALTAGGGACVVYSPHALAPAAGYLRIERALTRLTDRFLAVSESERGQLAELGVASTERTGVAYPTIDTQHFEPQPRDAARRSLGLAADGPLLVGIGRMCAQKRPLDFLEVLARLCMRLPALQAAWVGDGELRGAFENRARELGVAELVRITGWIPDVRPWIAAGDLVLSTSAFESFGYNLAEALAMERPAVGSRVCGTADVLRGLPGEVFFEVGDTNRAAEVVQRVLEQPSLAAALGREGRRLVERQFSSAQLRASLLAFYEAAGAEALARHGRKQGATA